MARPTAANSAVICCLLFLVLLSVSQIYSEVLGSGDLLRLLGGLVHAVMYICLVLAIGNFEQVLFRNQGEITMGWFEVLFSALAVVVSAGTIHRVCATSCLLFSAGATYFLYGVSKALHSTVETKASPSPVPGKKEKRSE
eukprot:TRINITY_DN12073_c0_g1_i1.p1 TRINITY_DN12073_c0_g1~~TRINITY_DN12073_c0_g1_i1.p1  ORF type:complete len:161 (+),score=25.39 TRINITY_DN12073_c0_g1_i1:66-485(+)